MNDTETRLRDYLQTKAADVPESAHGPGLQLDATSTSTRRRWAPMALAAASIGAVLILTVTFLNSLGGNQPGTASQPAGPLSAEAPRLPYAITLANNPDNPLDTWWATLHDGKTVVKNPGVKGNVIGRLGEGWLVMTGYPDAKKYQAAIVSPTGKVRPLGPLGAAGLAISPDHQQLAVGVAPYGAKESQVIVVNVDDGKEVASIRIPTAAVGPFGWNKQGIWITPPFHAGRGSWQVWQPGSKEVRQVPGLGQEIALAADADTIGYTTTDSKSGHCVRAATLGASGLEIKREYCAKDLNGARISLSADGGRMLLSDVWVAVDVASGKTTKLRLPAGLRSTYPSTFEDATDVIVLGNVPTTNTPQTMYRCRVTTGECKALRTEKAGESFEVAKP